MELLINAAIISVLGMGFVFTFLGIQVVVTSLVSNIAGKYAHLLPEPTKGSKRPAPVKPAAAAATTDNGELVAVVSAAIQKFNGR
ncbi:MAG: OadG family protein [Oligosphaeraceae bacterium]|nr:OadG family protein [Oligosphaeraceae bacterium]